MNANSDKDYIDAKVEAMHTLLDERLGAFQAVMDGRFAQVDARFAELRAEMAHNTAQLIKWMVGVWTGGIVLFIIVIAFVLNNAIPKAPPAAPAMQAPIVIQLPPQVWTQPAPASQQQP